MAKVFEKFGKDLGYQVDEDNRVSFADITYTSAKGVVRSGEKFFAPLNVLDEVWNNKFTKSNLGAECVICGSTDDIEMHHVRKIKDLRKPNSKLDFYTRQMAAINRKQVPLCSLHHIGLHKNT